MAINIKLNDVSISDHAKVITGVRMSETADFDVQAEKVKGMVMHSFSQTCRLNLL